MITIQEVIESLATRMDEKISNAHTALPCKVVKVRNDGTIDVKPYGRFWNGLKLIDYPTLTNVPVLSLNCSSVKIWLPVTVGDDCIVICLENNIDSWINKAESNVIDEKSLNNAVALMVGISAKSNNVRIGNETSYIEIGNKVTVHGDLTVTGRINP